MKTRNKTIQEWFADYPDTEIRRQLFKNTPFACYHIERTSFEYALNDAFIWNNTPEGKDYWGNIFLEAAKKTKLADIWNAHKPDPAPKPETKIKSLFPLFGIRCYLIKAKIKGCSIIGIAKINKDPLTKK